jgi:signal transduction histidine kinase
LKIFKSSNRFYSLITLSLLLISLITGALLVWSISLIVNYPDIGATWSFTSGIVYQLSTNHPNSSFIKIGDRVLTVNGHSASDNPLIFQGKSVGDSVDVYLFHDGMVVNAKLLLTAPTSATIINRIIPIPIAAVIWILCLLVPLFSIMEKKAIFFFLFFQSVTIMLILGNITAFGPEWSRLLFNSLILFIGPLTVFTHCLLIDTHHTRICKIASIILSTVAIFLWLLHILSPQINQILPNFDSLLKSLRYLWLAVSVLLLLAILIRQYINQIDTEIKYKIKIIFGANFLGILPLLVFSLIPQALFSYYLIPYEITLLFILILPLSYGFLVFRHHYLNIERYLNRSIAYLLILLITATIYSGFYLLIYETIHSEAIKPLLNWALLILLALFAHPLYNVLFMRIQKLLYGDWYDYQSAIKHVSQAININATKAEVIKAFIDGVQRVFQLEEVHLLWFYDKDKKVNFMAGLLENSALACMITLFSRDVFVYKMLFDKTTPIPIQLNQLIDKNNQLSLEEKEVINKKYVFIFPIFGSKGLIGALLLGNKRGREALSQSDFETLGVITNYASFAFENMALVDELKQSNQARIRLNQQVLQSSEKERKRLARELHDSVIQTLTAINYQCSQLRRDVGSSKENQVDSISSTIRNAILQLRHICADLRPPALDTLGLSAIVRSEIRSMYKPGTPRMKLEIIGEDNCEASEEVSLCLYRVLKEGLINAIKHSKANKILITLEYEPNLVKLLIEDDGVGFSLPERLLDLSMKGHYGIVGIQEWVDTTGGRFNLFSTPGKGCQLSIELPFHNNKSRFLKDQEAV